MVEATIEDLDIPTALRGYLTRSDGVAVLSTTLPKDTSCGQKREQRIKEKRWVLSCTVQRRREGGKGMTLKIFTGAKPFTKAIIEPFGIKEIEMLPKEEDIHKVKR